MNFQEQTSHGIANTIVPYNQTRETGLVERNSSFKSEMESAIETMLNQVAELGKYCKSSFEMYTPNRKKFVHFRKSLIYLFLPPI